MNLRYQQNLAACATAIVVLTTTSWPRIKASATLVMDAVSRAEPGSYAEVRVPATALESNGRSARVPERCDDHRERLLRS